MRRRGGARSEDHVVDRWEGYSIFGRSRVGFVGRKKKAEKPEKGGFLAWGRRFPTREGRAGSSEIFLAGTRPIDGTDRGSSPLP